MSVQVQSAPGLPDARLEEYIPHNEHLDTRVPEVVRKLVQDVPTKASTTSQPPSSQPIQHWVPPPSQWVSLIHPRAEEVAREVDGYFLEHWNFPHEKSKKVFVNAGFSRVTCFYFPLAKNDRIHFACRLLTFLFLIDG